MLTTILTVLFFVVTPVAPDSATTAPAATVTSEQPATVATDVEPLCI